MVGEAPGPAAAITTARALDPDVILMHLGAPGMAAADAVRLLAREVAGANVIVVTVPSDAELLGVLAAGASGALVDEAPADEIVAAIRAAAAGDAVFSPAIATALMRRLRLLGDGRVPELSARELEVLALVARGWDNARIAGALHLSTGTVKHHISSILRKLDVENRTQAAVRAVQHGLIERLRLRARTAFRSSFPSAGRDAPPRGGPGHPACAVRPRRAGGRSPPRCRAAPRSHGWTCRAVRAA